MNILFLRKIDIIKFHNLKITKFINLMNLIIFITPLNLKTILIYTCIKKIFLSIKYIIV